MSLTDEDREELDRLIDDAVLKVPHATPIFKRSSPGWYLKNPDDATFGFAWGYIMGSFQTTMGACLSNGTLTSKIMSEVTKIILSRSHEIRNAIHGIHR